MKFVKLIVLFQVLVFSFSKKATPAKRTTGSFHYTYSDTSNSASSAVPNTFRPTTFYQASPINQSTYYGENAYPAGKVPTFSKSFYYWRKGAEAAPAAPNVEDLQKELKDIKKEVWGKEDYSTEEIRKNNKAYDARWLLTQLKISRSLEIEDFLKSKQTAKRINKNKTDDNEKEEVEQNSNTEEKENNTEEEVEQNSITEEKENNTEEVN